MHPPPPALRAASLTSCCFLPWLPAPDSFEERGGAASNLTLLGARPAPARGHLRCPTSPPGTPGASAPRHRVLAKAALTVRGPKEGAQTEGALGACWGPQGAGGAPSLLCTRVGCAGVCTEGPRGVHTCVHRGTQCEVPMLWACPPVPGARRDKCHGTACAAAGATSSAPRSSWRALVRAGGLGAAPSRSWCLSQQRWPQAVTQGPGCLFFPAVSQPVRPVMLGLAAISRMAAWHLPLPHPDGQVPGAPRWGDASPRPLPCSPAPSPSSGIPPRYPGCAPRHGTVPRLGGCWAGSGEMRLRARAPGKL